MSSQVNLLDKQKTAVEVSRAILISQTCSNLLYQFWFLRAPNIVGQQRAEVNVKIYKDYGQMFTVFEEAVLATFSVMFSQLFDYRSDSVSLYDLNTKFKADLMEEITELGKDPGIMQIITLRHKFFAHRDNTGKHFLRLFPPKERTSELFDVILNVYGRITGRPMIFPADLASDELITLFDVILRSNPRRYPKINEN
jgi:hypothetical protein